MAVDPTDPETFAEEDDDFGEIDVEAPENAVAEQYEDVTAERDDPLEGWTPPGRTRRISPNRRAWSRWTRTTTADRTAPPGSPGSIQLHPAPS